MPILTDSEVEIFDNSSPAAQLTQIASRIQDLENGILPSDSISMNVPPFFMFFWAFFTRLWVIARISVSLSPSLAVWPKLQPSINISAF